MRSEVEDRLVVLIGEISEVPVEDITSETPLEDLGFDSLVLVELAMKLRKEFGVVASDEELDEVETVGELLRFATRARSA
ncbi:acyl carrier protein [Umezawaea sp. Da 62-37]|uniref:acyl carrier protein n=1 Tax=Umezawaea sp. Da 62-37 TaxID=3075927 RepID=UPI0028F6FA3F|nr:acyl carrier protein [Umezawaea sp. Da 62-37]WNV85400.1 acyl carrier protein [Umezawaea sp. Da 62-37]